MPCCADLIIIGHAISSVALRAEHRKRACELYNLGCFNERRMLQQLISALVLKHLLMSRRRYMVSKYGSQDKEWLESGRLLPGQEIDLPLETLAPGGAPVPAGTDGRCRANPNHDHGPFRLLLLFRRCS